MITTPKHYDLTPVQGFPFAINEVANQYNSGQFAAAAFLMALIPGFHPYDQTKDYILHGCYDDGNGNVSSSTQKVTITDLIPPEYVVLPEVKAHCSVNLITPKTTDNCEGVVIGTTSDPIFYDTPGVYHVNWVFNDGNGNITTTTQVVTIDNSFSPIAPILEDVITQCTVSVSEIPETSDHDCSGKVVATTTDALSYNTQGEYIIVWNFDFGGLRWNIFYFLCEKGVSILCILCFGCDGGLGLKIYIFLDNALSGDDRL